jgi:hypothetical protein
MNSKPLSILFLWLKVALVENLDRTTRRREDQQRDRGDSPLACGLDHVRKIVAQGGSLRYNLGPVGPDYEDKLGRVLSTIRCRIETHPRSWLLLFGAYHAP